MSLTRSVELHDWDRDEYSRAHGRQLTVALVVRGPGGAVTLDVLTGWALVPFGGGWELGADDRAPRDDGIHIHIDPVARPDLADCAGLSMPRCAYTRSGRCLHDIGAMGGHKTAVILARDGVDAAYAELEHWYRNRIGEPPVAPERADELGDTDAAVIA